MPPKGTKKNTTRQHSVDRATDSDSDVNNSDLDPAVPDSECKQTGCMRHYRSSHLSVSPPYTGRQSGDGLGVHTRSVDGLNLHTRPVRKQLHLGANITLPCTVLGDGFSPFNNPVIWYKVVGKEKLQLNNGGVVFQPFVGTGRYDIEPKMTNKPEPKVSMPLVLKGVTVADSGTYRCELLAAPDRILGNVTHTITVVAPVDSLTLTSNDTHPSPDNTTRHQLTLDMVEQTPYHVSCTARGGHPKPTLRVYHEKKDISEQFQLQVDEDKSGEEGLEVTQYTVSLTNPEFRAPVEYRGQHLRCVAKIHKAQDLKRTKTALIEVKYGPRFDCSVSDRVWAGDENVTLTCLLRANPPVRVDSVRWRWTLSGVNDTQEEKVLQGGERTEGGDYVSAVQLTQEGEVKVVLTIRNVTDEAFNTYTIEGTNDIAAGQSQVLLAAYTTVEPTTLEPTTEMITTPTPKDTILPENDPEKPAAAVTGGGATNRLSSPGQTMVVVLLPLLLLLASRQPMSTF